MLSIDTPDGYSRSWATSSVGQPSAELLDRALTGWEQFTGSRGEPNDD
ncbi:hypothetical protein [Streptomyces sp. NBC_00354]